MIEKEYGEYVLVCDVCDIAADTEGGLTFQEAVDSKKALGWKSQKRNGEWIDVYPECQGAE